ncbi:MAG: uroporphyrinogen-III C-methyltransferase [Candidatus Omnitrophica bacterium]|nr:uroporphyrinogen-III C-methyltransferase [Candidatus Omnitrophota bacterium]
MIGAVYFVGAGPGDPELITLRGAELLKKADCVIYDRLADPRLLRWTKRTCQRIYVGKKSDEGGESQTRINRLLVQKSRRHSTVVRLKGGDPTVFGRISEEMGALSKAGIRFEIIPGVSSVWAAAAAAGIPLTDREFSSSVAVVTGQQAAGKKESVRWKNLSRGVDTLVVLMGRSALPTIVRRIRAAGRPASTPIGLIRWATTRRQEILISTLGKIREELKRRPEFGPPVVTIIGEVVRRVENKPLKGLQPLKGKRILVTRPKEDAAGLARRLEALGATCVSLPTIEIRPRGLSSSEAKRLSEKLPRYGWILFTSHHGVEALQRIVRRRKGLIRGKICAIGPRTAESVRAAGLKTELVPSEFSTDGIREAFRRIQIRSRKILIPRSNLGARDALAQELRRRGALVDEAILYETVNLKIPPVRLKKALHRINAATFTSASTVKGFFKALEEAKIPVRSALNGAAVAAIGPATADALKRGGIRRFHLPREGWTIEGLIKTVIDVTGHGSTGSP